MKKLLFLLIVLGIHFSSSAQENSKEIKSKKYSIKIYNTQAEDVELMSFIQKITQAEKIHFDTNTQSYVLETKRELDQNVVAGKLQKQYKPMEKMEDLTPFERKPFPQMNNTGNPEQDALDYDQKKKAWIEANPEEYQKMTKGTNDPK